MVARWRVLRQLIITSLETTEAITLACIALHNWLVSIKEVSPKNYCPDFPSAVSARSEKQRDALADYFQNAGAIPFQWDKKM